MRGEVVKESIIRVERLTADNYAFVSWDGKRVTIYKAIETLNGYGERNQYRNFMKLQQSIIQGSLDRMKQVKESFKRFTINLDEWYGTLGSDMDSFLKFEREMESKKKLAPTRSEFEKLKNEMESIKEDKGGLDSKPTKISGLSDAEKMRIHKNKRKKERDTQSKNETEEDEKDDD